MRSKLVFPHLSESFQKNYSVNLWLRMTARYRSLRKLIGNRNFPCRHVLDWKSQRSVSPCFGWKIIAFLVAMFWVENHHFPCRVLGGKSSLSLSPCFGWKIITFRVAVFWVENHYFPSRRVLGGKSSLSLSPCFGWKIITFRVAK